MGVSAARAKSGRSVGIDVGSGSAWVVVLEGGERPVLRETLLSHPLDLTLLADLVDGADCVAVDAPGEPSTLPHLGDERLAAKFQTARCGEVALRRGGIAVPWVTPPAAANPPAWMSSGFSIWSALRERGVEPVETYPHGIFWRLAGRPLLHKQQPAGLTARAGLLFSLVETVPGLSMWSHDGLDALAAAYLATLVSRGDAQRIDCHGDEAWAVHDSSAIWLPARVSDGTEALIS